jgi:Mrp family chromosome partitioning ATPase
VTSVIFAAMAGIVLGLLLAVGREALDSRVRGRKDAEEWFGAPVVGALPKGLGGRPLPGTANGQGRWGDDERIASLELLRARLQFAQMGIAGPTILVTSAGSDGETSTVTANLGAALARAGKRVVCVDADLRHPALHEYLRLPSVSPGFVDVLEEAVDLEQALVRVELSGASNGAGPSGDGSGRLEVLPAGNPPSLTGTITPESVEGLMSRLRERADYVVVDSPPLLVAESFPLALKSDNILVVARRGRTTRGQAESVRATLDGLGVEHVGVVLTHATPADR